MPVLTNSKIYSYIATHFLIIIIIILLLLLLLLLLFIFSYKMFLSVVVALRQVIQRHPTKTKYTQKGGNKEKKTISH